MVYKMKTDFFKFIISYFLIFGFSYSSILPENDWEKREIKGRVKEMSETIYKYGFSGNDNIVKRIKTYFNQEGYITKEIHYYNEKINYILNFEYDQEGKLIQSNDYTGEVYIHEYEIDKNDNLVETKKEKKKKASNAYEKIEINIYSKDGKTIRTKLYNKTIYKALSPTIKIKGRGTFELLSDYSFEYNVQGKRIKMIDNIYPDLTINYTYENQENGKIKKTVSRPGQIYITIYDQEGREKEYYWITRPSAQIEPLFQLMLFYDTKYDEVGNLTERISNRVEWATEDPSNNECIHKGIFEKRKIQYQYYE